MRQKGFSLILPCYNLEKTLYQNIKQVTECLAQHCAFFEVIAVDDGSTDNTYAVLEQAERDFGIRVVHYPTNQGKGYAVRQGVFLAQYEAVGFLDADLAIPIVEIVSFLDALQTGSDLVIASRLQPGGKVTVPVSKHRQYMEKIFRYLRIAIIGGRSVKDTQCGCKVFRYAVAQDLFARMRINRFAFDAELIFLALQKQYKVKEVAITLQNPQASSIRLLKDSLGMLYDLIRVRGYAILGKYTQKHVRHYLQHQNLTVTFDDFGISQKVNERILELIPKLSQARVAIMMRGQISETERQALLQSGASLDVHLDRHETLCIQQQSGLLARIGAFMGEYWVHQEKSVTQIWTEQVEAFVQFFGQAPQSLNTHEHVHFFPAYTKSFLALAKQYSVSSVRFGTRWVYQYHPVAIILNLLRWWQRKMFAQTHLHTTAYLISWDWLERDEFALGRYVEQGTVEVIFHVERDEEYYFLKNTLG